MSDSKTGAQGWIDAHVSTMAVSKPMDDVSLGAFSSNDIPTALNSSKIRLFSTLSDADQLRLLKSFDSSAPSLSQEVIPSSSGAATPSVGVASRAHFFTIKSAGFVLFPIELLANVSEVHVDASSSLSLIPWPLPASFPFDVLSKADWIRVRDFSFTSLLPQSRNLKILQKHWCKLPD